MPDLGFEHNGFLVRLAPDPVLPAQFFADHGPQRWTPELRLVYAVLEDALKVISWKPWTWGPRANPGQRKEYEQTCAWFAAEEYDPFSFSFVWTCEVLGVDPVGVRRHVAAVIARAREQEIQEAA